VRLVIWILDGKTGLLAGLLAGKQSKEKNSNTFLHTQLPQGVGDSAKTIQGHELESWCLIGPLR